MIKKWFINYINKSDSPDSEGMSCKLIVVGAIPTSDSNYYI